MPQHHTSITMLLRGISSIVAHLPTFHPFILRRALSTIYSIVELIGMQMPQELPQCHSSLHSAVVSTTGRVPAVQALAAEETLCAHFSTTSSLCKCNNIPSQQLSTH